MRSWRHLLETQPSNHGQVVGIAAAVLVSAYLALLYLPRRAAMQELARQCEQLGEQLEGSAATQSASLNDPEFTDTQLEQRVSEMERALPESDNTAELATALAQLAHTAGLRLHRVERRLDTNDGAAAAVVVALTVHGAFAQVMELLGAIENLSRIVEVDSLALKAVTSDARKGDDKPRWVDEPTILQARMELWAYRWAPGLTPADNRRHARVAPTDVGVDVEP